MRILLKTLALLTVSAACYAQSAGGLAAISGEVHDPSGSVVPKAQVAITSQSLGKVRTIESNGSGLFSAPGLIPGAGYKLEVTATGFAPYETSNFDLQVGQNLNLTVALAVGQTSSTVEVTGAAEIIENTRTDVSQVVGERDIMDLPINGRRVDQFVLNVPGVSNDGTFGLLSFRGVEGNNSFLLDGNDNTEQLYDENAGRNRIQSQVSADAVQEFQVVSSNVSAEYGRAMGGVINTVTKSGGNDVHGTGFYFLRSTGMNAQDVYSAFKPSERRYQTGFTVGGPAIKNKLFYFLSTDITRRNFPMVDSQVKVGTIDSVNQVWLGCAAPATPAQCSAINGLLPRFFGQIPRKASNDLYFGRMDYRFSDRNTFSASFNFLRWVSPNGITSAISSTTGTGITSNGDDSVTVRNGKATWTTVLGANFVNAFRYGIDTDRQADDFNAALLGGGLGYLNASVATVQLGPPNYLPRIQPMETRNSFADDVTWTKSKHIVKAGVNFVNSRDYISYLNNRYGSYTYQTVTAFAQDYSGNTTGAKNWTSYSQTFGQPVVGFSIRELGLYLQDQWRATNRLTITYGARYEHSFAPTPTIVNPDYPETGSIHTGSMNLMPRIGFSYNVNDKTVIRAGFGTFFARLVGGIVEDVLSGQGLYQTTNSLTSSNPALFAAGPVFPNALAAPVTGLSSGASVLDITSPKLKTPYSGQASLSVERQLAKDIVLSVSGIFSRGVNLYGTTDINAPALGPNFTYTINDDKGNKVGSYTTPVYLNPRPSTKYGAVYELTNGVSSSYNGLAVSLQKRFSHGFQSGLAYTWSHSIDDGQGSSTNAVFGFSTAPWTYNGDYSFDKASSNNDQRHRLALSFVWAPTITHSNSLFAKYVVNNWQLSGIGTMASGRPAASPTVRLTDTPVAGMLSSSSLNGFGGNFRVPFMQANSLYTPASFRGDMRLTKIIPLVTEKVRLSLNFEAFNISNSWTPTSLTNQAYTEAKGVLTYTPTAFNVGSGDGGFPDGTQARRLQVSARIVF